MSESPRDLSPQRDPADRLDSWKEIAAHLKRDVTTVQRWERREAMPVHRHVHDKLGSVYAYRSELDAWTRGRSASKPAEPDGDAEPLDGFRAADPPPTRLQGRGRRLVLLGAGTAAIVALVLAAWWTQRPPEAEAPLLAGARFSQLSNFGGTEQAAAISRDGRFVAFLSDQDGPTDVWVTQIGTGRFYNLTRGAFTDLANPAVRTLGFSPDGSLVTFWTRRVGAAGQAQTSIWAVPVLGGPARPYLEDAAELDWSRDGDRLVYHTIAAGDPMFVTGTLATPRGTPIFAASAGDHSHFVVWSPDGAFIYFVQGTLPDRLDIWRIKPTGGPPERLTHHESQVSHPVFLNARTLAYLASDADGSGPWLHSLDLDERIPRRTTVGIDRYTSLAASADGRRLVATRASSQGTLWRLPIAAAPSSNAAAHRVPLTTGNGSSPRLGADSLLYVASNGTSDRLWRLHNGVPAEVWSADRARISGGPALARGGDRVAFTIEQDGRTSLIVANADGTGARPVLSGVELRGAPAWSADGSAIAIAVVERGVPRVHRVPLDGGAPAVFLEEYSVDPVWAPDGNLMVFSGPDIGTTLSVRAAAADATTSALHDLRLARGGRRVVFMPGQRALVVLRGGIGHKNLWLVDIESGAERQLTDFAPDFVVRDFDVSADGRELVVEQANERSDVVLLDLARAVGSAYSRLTRRGLFAAVVDGVTRPGEVSVWSVTDHE
jgi:Tol biopolymer transport system component